jgi:hypothetical protein
MRDLNRPSGHAIPESADGLSAGQEQLIPVAHREESNVAGLSLVFLEEGGNDEGGGSWAAGSASRFDASPRSAADSEKGDAEKTVDSACGAVHQRRLIDRERYLHENLFFPSDGSRRTRRFVGASA